MHSLVARGTAAVILLLSLALAGGPAVAQQWQEPVEKVILQIDNQTGEELCISFDSLGGTCNLPPGRSDVKLPRCGLDMYGQPYCVYTATVHKGATQIGQIVTESGIVTNQYDLSTMWVCAQAHIPAETIRRQWNPEKPLVAPWEIVAGVAEGCQPPGVIRR